MYTKVISKVIIKPAADNKMKKEIVTYYELFKQEQQYYPDLTIQDIQILEESINA